MSSQLYGNIITPTTPQNAERYPILASHVIVCYSAPNDEKEGERHEQLQLLKPYTQLPDEEDNENKDGSGSEQGDSASDGDISADEKDSEMNNADNPPMGIDLRGICLTLGVHLGPLVRCHLFHCVIGIPAQDLSLLSSHSEAAVVGHPFSEASLERCVVYGGWRYVVYAYPRCAIKFLSCILEGLSENTRNFISPGGDQSKRKSIAHLPSGIKPIRSRQNESFGGRNHPEGTEDDSHMEKSSSLQREFVNRIRKICQVPFSSSDSLSSSAITTIGVFCDNADISITECVIGNTQLGIIIYQGCHGTCIIASQIQSIREIGIYAHGMAGKFTIRQCVIAGCGREALLVSGPREDQIIKVEQQWLIAPDAVKAQYLIQTKELDNLEEMDEEDMEFSARIGKPSFAQHPVVQNCHIFGRVRFQGCVRDGAMADNFIYIPHNADERNFKSEQSTVLDPEMYKKTEKKPKTPAATTISSAYIQPPTFGVKKQWPIHGFTILHEKHTQKATAIEG
ncbi:unnamed protein product [Phytomonas sp. Hart1]|nr:unnamed protein product [Phytomonas sp. Hart1]|eukprot:CCW70153.1 unnamed protein product [Phytomonas sp. isolate Hart1]